MRKLLVLAIMVLNGLSALAYDAEINGIYYNLIGEDAIVTFCDDNHNSYFGSVVIPEHVTYNEVDYSVTSIGSSAFAGCCNLTSISIPKSVKSIGLQAFYGCSKLASVYISDMASWCSISFCVNEEWNPQTIYDSVVRELLFGAYYSSQPLFYAQHLYLNGQDVKNLVIPNNVTSISDFAFCYYKGLKSVVIPNSVKCISRKAFDGCCNLTSVNIGDGVTSIGNEAFWDCKLKSVLVKCAIPPMLNEDSFTNQSFYHTTLYIPSGCWNAYAYDNSWYKFINIRETAITEEEILEHQAYTLMDANTFAYSVYDPVNDCIGTINSISGINEDNPNHSWQMIEAGGMRYLYNIGAKKYVKRNGNSLELTNIPEPIEVEDGDNGIILGAQVNKQWALVSNERMSVAQAAIDEVTGIRSLTPALSQGEGDTYDLSGRKKAIDKWPHVYIMNGKKYVKH